MECKRDSFSGALGGARETHWERETHFQCVSPAPPWEPLELSLLHSIVFHIVLRGAKHPLFRTFVSPLCVASVPMWFSSCWARLNTLSLALSWALWCCLCCTHVIFNRVEPPLKAMWNTLSVCLSCSAESATKALSLALHSVPRVFHLALRRCETLWSAREIASIALSAEQARHSHGLKVMWRVDITSQFFSTSFRLVFDEIRPGR